MRFRREVAGFLVGCSMWLGFAVAAWASPYRGQVVFNGLPLPGSQVTVTATQGDKKVSVITDDSGMFNFADLADGNWTLDIEMTGFTPIKQTVAVGPTIPVGTFEMKLLSLNDIRNTDKPVKVDSNAPVVVASASAPAATPAAGAASGAAGTAGAGSAAAKGKGNAKNAAAPAGGGGAPAPEPQDAQAAQASDGFLINGSVNNAATSQFSLNQAFGNNRSASRWKYNGGANLTISDSVLNAAPYSLNGSPTAKTPALNLVGGFQVGGPLEIPHLLPYARAPYFYAGYQRTQNNSETLVTTFVPTTAMMGGNLSAAPNVTTIYAPTSGLSTACLSAPGVVPGQPFPNNVIPAACISSQANAILQRFYLPLQPNSTTSSRYNYQEGLTSSTHTDSYRGQLQKGFGNKNNLNGNVTIQDSRSASPSVFGFRDKNGSLSEAVSISWYHRFTQRLSLQSGYNFSRARSNSYSNFANQNIEATLGISGFDTADPLYYGPPSIGFTTSGISSLSDGSESKSAGETNAISEQLQWNRFRHNMTFGGDFRRQEWNSLSQSNPRGSMSFTGQQTQNSTQTGGYDFADFLLGLPETASIAYGNADKYLRQSAYDLYADDDFRVNPELSIRAGIRWEYGAPITELKNRLVNMYPTPGFADVTPVVGTSPSGSLDGHNYSYPTSLIRPDYSFPEPRIGIAWRPISGSSLLVRAGYGIYNDTSVYLATARAMDQQSPLSYAQSLPNSPACPYTMANPFQHLSCATTTATTFAVDPNFKVGYAQLWNLQVSRDLPFALALTVIYVGIKGTRGVQEILPNTCAIAVGQSATAPCGSAPSGYYWRDSEGDSTSESGTVQLRRRLKNGFTASVQYRYSKALDDDYSLGGQGPTPGSSGNTQVAQDWTNPAGQRGLSTFDQRNVLNASIQYTTGMGLGGHTLMSGWRAVAYKDWTVLLNIGESSGTPLTPVYSALIPGATCTSCLRPSLTGQPIKGNLAAGFFLNQAAYAAPASGTFGNARRDSITGPNTFSLNAQMSRSFRIHDRYNLSAEIDANNLLNHVAFTSWNTTWNPAGSPLFGLPSGTNGARTIVLNLRGRF